MVAFACNPSIWRWYVEMADPGKRQGLLPWCVAN